VFLKISKKFVKVLRKKVSYGSKLLKAFLKIMVDGGEWHGMGRNGKEWEGM